MATALESAVSPEVAIEYVVLGRDALPRTASVYTN
jgi:hypothetical protein